MAEVDTSFYRPQPGSDPLSQIGRIGGAANALGDLAVGQGMQQALDPATGQVDQNKLLSLLKQSPVGAMKAVPTMDALQKLRQAGFAADQAGLETFQKRMALTSHLFSGLASKKTPTMDDVHDIAAQALDPALDGKKYGITLPVVMNAVKALRESFKAGGSPALRAKALEIQTQAASTAEVLQQHSPGYTLVDRGGNLEMVPTGTRSDPAVGTVVPKNQGPDTVVATPGGPRYLGEQPAPPPAAIAPARGVSPGAGLPRPDASAAPGASGKAQGRAPASGPPVPMGPAAGQEPGFTEAASGIGSQSAKSANELTVANDTSPARKGILGNLEDMIGKFTPGKAADWTLVAKNFATRNVPMPDSWKKDGAPFDVKSIASQEEFNKQSVQLAQQQFAAIGGTGTDAKFNSAYETSPNETLSKLGNQGIIKLLKGNEDAIQAKNKAWQAWQKSGNGPHTYAQFSANFNDHFDPRVFQFKYLSPKERQDYFDKIDDNDKAKLLHDVTYARKQNWVKY